MHIWPEPIQEEEGYIIIPFTLELPNQDRKELWYRFPENCASFLAESCDSFLLAAIFSAMRAGAVLHVHGAVSPSLLQNLEEFQAAWASWRPERYHMVEVRAEVEMEAPAAEPPAAVMAFSGGVDSAFTAYSHCNGLYGRRTQPLQAALFIQGFDMPLNRLEGATIALNKARQMVESLGLDFIPVSTNIRHIRDDLLDSHGAKIISTLMLLSRRFQIGLIASSNAYQTMYLPWGSNPMTDPFLGNKTFRVAHDGASFSRLEKVARIVKWPEARQNLRVCNKGLPDGENCCRCEKCQRVMMCFLLVEPALPPCFSRPLNPWNLLRISYKEESLVGINQQILQEARRLRIHSAWVFAHAAAIQINRSKLSLKRWLHWRQEV